MMQIFAAALWALVLATGAALLDVRPAAAHEYTAGAIHIDHPTANPTPGGRLISAAYMTIHNGGSQADRLVSVSTPLAGRVEIHRSIRGDDGTMRMELQSGGLPLPAGQLTTLEPGGLHIMLFDLSRPLADGDELPLTLEFERAGRVNVVAMVERRSTAPSGGAHHHH
jgi:copper(I)-binding protein